MDDKEQIMNNPLYAKFILPVVILVSAPLQIHAEEYRYDDLGRLVEVVKDDFEFTGYDENSTRQTYIASESEFYEYDILGNRIQKQIKATRIKK